MTRDSLTAIAFAAAVGLAAVGCGGGNDGSGGNNTVDSGVPYNGQTIQATSGPYQPLAVGATWTYHVDDMGIVYDKQSTVLAQEDIGGAKAGVSGFKVQETIKSATQLTWYEVTATDVRRHHDQLMDGAGTLASDEWYDPYWLRVDETPAHLQKDAAWTVNYSNTKTTPTKPTAVINHAEAWVIEGVDVPITVPAGTFAALQVRRADSADAMVKTQWFVRGVGKVRELTSAGHLEELTAYSIP
jgi:hypothetical protein